MALEAHEKSERYTGNTPTALYAPDLLIVNIVVLPVRPPIQIVLRVVGPEPRPVLIVDRLPVEQIVDVVLEVEALEFHTSETI